MRPFLDDRLFPGLPKFLWFDDGSASDGTGGDASGSSGTAAATGDAATAAGIGGQAAAAGYGFGSGMGSGTGANTGAPAGTSTTGTGGFGGFGGGNTAAPAASATGTSVGMGPGSAASGSGGSPGVGPAGGVSTAATTGGGGGGGGATGPGAATGGTATGGGGGTAAGGSGASPGLTPDVIAIINHAFGGSPGDALRGGTNLSQIAVGGGMGTPFGVPSLGVPFGSGATSGPNAAPGLQPGQGKIAVRAAPDTAGTSLGTNDTGDQVSPPGTPNPFAFRGVPGNMGFPAAGLAHTPSGGYTSSLGAPAGSSIGQATINAPPTNPNVPAVGSHNANGGLGISSGGLAPGTVAGTPGAAPGTPSVDSNPTSPTSPYSQMPSSPNIEDRRWPSAVANDRNFFNVPNFPLPTLTPGETGNQSPPPYQASPNQPAPIDPSQYPHSNPMAGPSSLMDMLIATVQGNPSLLALAQQALQG